MKKYIIILIALCNSLTISAQKRTVVEGLIPGSVNEKVTLNLNSGFPNYELSFVANAITDYSGNFKMSFPYSETGFVRFYYKGLYHDIFIEPGDSLHLIYEEKSDSFIFSGKGGSNNNFNYPFNKKFEEGIYSLISQRDAGYADPMYLGKLYDSLLNNEINFYNSNQVNCNVIPECKSYLVDNSSIIWGSNPNLSPAYNSYIKSQISYGWAYQKLVAASMYEWCNGNSMLDLIPDSSYYSFLKNIKVEDGAALSSTAYADFLYYYVSYRAKLDRQKNGWKDDNIKGLFWQKIYQAAKTNFHGAVLDMALAKIMIRCLASADVDSIGSLVDDYTSHCNDKVLKNYVETRYELKKNAWLGNKAYDFTLSDKSGNKVSLHDFKGKIVYMDFSAPWCSPCRQEIPYADSLVEYFKNKDVQFVFISVYDVIDTPFDASITENNRAVHLYARKQFSDPAVLGYNVTSIPRFVLIDRDGMIADLNAKRPSGKAKEEIEGLLKSSP